MNTRIRRTFIAAWMGLAVAAGATAGMAAAGATPAQDAQFLALITSPPAGMQPLVFESADVAILEGKAACGMLDDNYSLLQTVNGVDAVLPVNRDGAITLVSAAVVTYCPWHNPTRGQAA